MSQEDMRTRAFADTLNGGVTNKEYHYWTQSAGQRRGYPYLTQNPYVEQTYTDSDSGITVSGMIHTGALFQVKKLDPKDKDFKRLDWYVKGQNLRTVYKINLDIQGKDKGGKAFENSVTLAFPAGADVRAADYWIVHDNGEAVHVHEDIPLKDGKLEVQVEALHTFAVISKEGAQIRTGDKKQTLPLAFLGMSALAIAGSLYYKRRKNIR